MSGDPRPALSAGIAPLLERDGMRSNAADALSTIARIGYRAVQWSATVAGVRPRDLDDGARRGLRSELRRLELACSGVDVWIPPGHFLDAATIDRAVDALRDAIEFAAALAEPGRERPVVCTMLPSLAERKAVVSSAALDDAVRTIASIAEREGILVADHAVEADARLAVGVDPPAAFASSADPVALVAQAGARLASARLVDLFRSGLRGPVGEPGEARLDLDHYRAALDVVGFRRPLVVDARQWRDPRGGLVISVERWAGGPIARLGASRPAQSEGSVT